MDIREFSMDLFSLKGKAAIVTGGNTGLGQAFALALAKAGADVFIPTVIDDGGETLGLIEAAGSRAEVLTADITVAGTPKLVVDGCAAAFGAVDIVVNFGRHVQYRISRQVRPERMGPDDRPQPDGRLRAQLRGLQAHIGQRSGKIINIASLFSFLGGQWSPAYAATKHGLVGFTKAYCDELAQYNVQVNAIALGTTGRRSRRQPAQTPRPTSVCWTTSLRDGGVTPLTSWGPLSSWRVVPPTT